MLLGHWGTTPGQNFIYVHLNRVIKKYDLDMIYVSGPGHGGPAVVANTYLEGTYSEIYPEHQPGRGRAARSCSRSSPFPAEFPATHRPECPGSIHEGGELGYSLSHSFGAVFDNPDLIVACVVGDGEAETGPLATAWHSNKFLNPVTDGAVLPILHLNGYKISNPTVLARISREELEQLLRGYGWTPYFVEGHEPELMHEAMAATLDTAVRADQANPAGRPRAAATPTRPRWPMIVLELAQGLDRTESRRRPADRRHIPRAPGAAVRSGAAPRSTCSCSKEWLKSYRPEELFDERRPPASRNWPSWRPSGDAAHGRQPARQRRHAAARSATCRIFATMRSPSPCPGVARHRRYARARTVPARRDRNSTRRSATFASSAPTRRCPTAWRRYSR